MINTVFGNSMENVRKHRNIKPFVIESRRKYLVPNYHSTKFHIENSLKIEMKKMKYLQINMFI